MIKKFVLDFKRLFYWIDSFLLKVPIIGPRLYLRQLVKFTLVGGLITIIDFAVYIFLTRVFLFWRDHYLWANFIGMSVGAVASFIANKNWVFKNQGKKVTAQYFKFWLAGGVGGMILYQILLMAFVETLFLYDLLAKALAALIILFFRFVLQKFWIFK